MILSFFFSSRACIPECKSFLPSRKLKELAGSQNDLSKSSKVWDMQHSHSILRSCITFEKKKKTFFVGDKM